MCASPNDYPTTVTLAPNIGRPIDRDKVALRELYHNPDPIFRLIGTANETDVIIEDQTVKGLIDSGAQISSISDTFASKLGLRIKQLNTLLDLEPTGGGQVPYHGYVELRMRVPNVRAFDLDVLMLVIPESEYSRGVPITIGTIHIDEIIDLITDKEMLEIGAIRKLRAMEISGKGYESSMPRVCG